MRQFVVNAQVALRDMIVYSDSLADSRSRALNVFADLDKALDDVEPVEPLAPEPNRNDFALFLPAGRVFATDRNEYVQGEARTLYVIGDFVTDSKIYAIKHVRHRDNNGLREAKQGDLHLSRLDEACCARV